LRIEDIMYELLGRKAVDTRKYTPLSGPSKLMIGKCQFLGLAGFDENYVSQSVSTFRSSSVLKSKYFEAKMKIYANIDLTLAL